MVARAVTVAFDGVDARRVDVEVQLVGASQPSFTLVGLPDKAVAESRERVRGAFAGIGLALPPKRIIASLAPADLPKEGSHFDLPIALALLAAMGVVPLDALDGWWHFFGLLRGEADLLEDRAAALRAWTESTDPAGQERASLRLVRLGTAIAALRRGEWDEETDASAEASAGVGEDPSRDTP